MSQNEKKQLTQLPKIISDLYRAVNAAKTCLGYEDRQALRNTLNQVESSYYKLWDKVYGTSYTMKYKNA